MPSKNLNSTPFTLSIACTPSCTTSAEIMYPFLQAETSLNLPAFNSQLDAPKPMYNTLPQKKRTKSSFPTCLYRVFQQIYTPTKLELRVLLFLRLPALTSEIRFNPFILSSEITLQGPYAGLKPP